MGEIKKVLSTRHLPDREEHNSRLFVDLSEQVHIHFREFRSQFSVEEFYEYADTITRSAKDLKRYLKWHPKYREQEHFDVVTVALGPEQQTRPFISSPVPHKSKYFPNRLQVELQGEEVIDEIHIHYRDYRLAMNRETLREFADGIGEAVTALDSYLAVQDYQPKMHPFRKMLVEDKYYESREWKGTDKTSISLTQKIKSTLFYMGGDNLVQFVKRLISPFKRK